MSSPRNRTLRTRRRFGPSTPPAECNVSMWKNTASPGPSAHPTTGYRSGSASMSGSSASVPGANHLAWSSRNVRRLCCYPTSCSRGSKSLETHHLLLGFPGVRNAEVEGSSPLPSTTFSCENRPIGSKASRSPSRSRVPRSLATGVRFLRQLDRPFGEVAGVEGRQSAGVRSPTASCGRPSCPPRSASNLFASTAVQLGSTSHDPPTPVSSRPRSRVCSDHDDSSAYHGPATPHRHPDGRRRCAWSQRGDSSGGEGGRHVSMPVHRSRG